jgi:hypothetical protein
MKLCRLLGIKHGATTLSITTLTITAIICNQK